MFADGKIAKVELEMLKQYARTNGIPQQTFNEIFFAAKAGEAVPQAAMNPREIAETFRGLAELSLADGTISDSEMAMLNEFGRRGKIPANEMARILESEKVKAVRLV